MTEQEEKQDFEGEKGGVSGLPVMSLDALSRVRGGAFAAAFENLMHKSVEDITRAPDIDKPRVITISIELHPRTIDTGDGSGPELSAIEQIIRFGHKSPERQFTILGIPRSEEHTSELQSH